MSELLRTENLSVHFPVKNAGLCNTFFGDKKCVKAVDGISFVIDRGEAVALVGESGCGKTTIGKALVSLVKPTGGKIYYCGEDVSHPKQVKRLRKHIQYIFQDPYSSLNPRMVAGTIITRPMKIHGLYKDPSKIKERLYLLLEQVGLTKEQALRFPHEFSGGQKQRISIARALAVEPELIIADEPTAALDVSIQAQILGLLMELKKMLGLTMIFISHDLGVVEYISDRTMVMYLGTIVESGPTKQIIKNPLHPYTKALISAVPKNPLQNKTEKFMLKGSIPSPVNIPGGCRLHPRCPYAIPACSSTNVKLEEVVKGRQVACLRVQNELDFPYHVGNSNIKED